MPVAQAIASLFQEAEANLGVVIETATDAIIAFDEKGRVLLWSGAAEQLLSYPKEEVLGHGLGGLLGARRSVERWTAQQGLPGSTDGIVRLDQNLQTDVRRRDGTTFTAELSASARIGKATWVGIVILRDITERKRTMERLVRFNRDLRTISLCNQILVREPSEEALLREVCRIIVEVGGHRAAWVGLVSEGTDRSLLPAAVVGCDPERVDRHVADLADPAWERCPIVTAIRTGAVQVVPDIRGGPPRCPWHDEAVRLGFRASIALPLTQDERPFGALTIYSAHRDAFDAEDVKLLSELADDLAYGIRAIRTRLAHERALVEIESLARFPGENPNPVLRVEKEWDGGVRERAQRTAAPALGDRRRRPDAGRVAWEDSTGAGDARAGASRRCLRRSHLFVHPGGGPGRGTMSTSTVATSPTAGGPRRRSETARRAIVRSSRTC